MKTYVLTIHSNIQLFWVMALISLICSASYMFFINQTIHQVAKRVALEQELSERVATIAELEFKYIALSNTIDLTLAKSLGFEEAQPSVFVSRKQSVAFAARSFSSQ